jgi:hypothetical protein
MECDLMLNLYRGDDAVLTVIDQETLSDTNNFSATSEPNYLRIYTTGHPNGQLLSKHTGLQADLPADEWMYLTETDEILLGQSYTGTVITYDGTVFIFDDEGVAGTGIESERTLSATLSLVNEYTDFKCVSIELSSLEYFADANIDTTIVSYSLDGETYASTLSVSNMIPDAETTVYIKAIIPEGTGTMNYRNIGLKKDYQTEFYE